MSVSLAKSFRGRSVFVTGHTGFKGSWLTIWLHRLGARITGYALAPPTDPNNFELARLRALLAAHHTGDVCAGLPLQKALCAADPDVLFHLAAQPIVRIGYEQPGHTFATNIMGTVNVLEAIRLRGKPCVVIIVTSDKCYEIPDGYPPANRTDGLIETDRLGGHDPYSASKGAAELVVAAYRRSYFRAERHAEHGVRLATVRAGNVIGGGDWGKDRIIPDIVRGIAAGHPVLVRNPDAVRPWQHVLEPLNGYLLLAARLLDSPTDPHHGRLCDAWNFGPPTGDDLPVRMLVERFIAACGAGSWRDGSASSAHPHETTVLRLSSAKANSVLGWRPRWRIDEALRRTAAWYRRHLDDPAADMRSACLEDLAAYETTGATE